MSACDDILIGSDLQAKLLTMAVFPSIVVYLRVPCFLSNSLQMNFAIL